MKVIIKKFDFLMIVKKNYYFKDINYLRHLRDALDVLIYWKTRDGDYIDYLKDKRFLEGVIQYEFISKD